MTKAARSPQPFAGADSWVSHNQRYLWAAVTALAQTLQPDGDAATSNFAWPPWTLAQPPALTTLAQRLQLSPFEQRVVLLGAAIELEPSLAEVCAQIQGVPPRPYPTLQLALQHLPHAHWDALTPTAPLRHWQLVHLLGEEPLICRPLRLDERILHYLMGLDYLERSLQPYLQPLTVSSPLPPSQQAIADQIQQRWQGRSPCAINLYGAAATSRRAIAATAGQALEGRLFTLVGSALPADREQRDALRRQWEREALLTDSVLLVELDGGEGDQGRSWLQRLSTPVLISSPEPVRLGDRPLLRWPVDRPSHAEQTALWQQALGPAAAALNGQLTRVVSQFDLAPEQIHQASQELESQVDAETSLGQQLWDTCRQRSRLQLEDLAQRLEPFGQWDDLVLPPPQKRILADIVASVEQRSQVYEQWGFGRSRRGLGISALFAGSSGTGKTLAAEILAQTLQLDLYRIDLSAVVSKYIGETEKNLRRIFDAADRGGAILLFDEADALFGKRSEVKDAHDRHANIEVSYLLQRMEAYRGLAILTTNFKQAIDTAFLRRIRYVVTFPFPDPQQRAAIWRRVFPPATPTQGLDYDRLSRLTVAGGNIRSIAMNAAFLAAAEQQPVTMTHLLRSTQSEYAKLEKPLAAAEVRGWL